MAAKFGPRRRPSAGLTVEAAVAIPAGQMEPATTPSTRRKAPKHNAVTTKWRRDDGRTQE